jgi:hypothetical protein
VDRWHYQNNPVMTYEVILCTECKGKGYTTESVCTDYHRREYDSRHHGCTRCKGSGRLTKKTAVTYEAYNS